MNSYLTLLVVVCLASCASHSSILPATEYVLTEGMRVSARTPNGDVTIIGGPGTQRTFIGDGWRKTQNLIPRRSRWYGSLGLYDPAASWSQYGRLLVDEGRLFFESESEALRYLYVGSSHFKPIFTNTGLVVGLDVIAIPGGEATRDIQIWQIYINGKRPRSLPGADDNSITVTGGHIPDNATPNPAPIGYEKTLGPEEYVPDKRKS